MECCVGVDIGGMSLKVGLVDERGRLLGSRRAPTEAATSSGEDVLDRVVTLALDMVRQYHVRPEQWLAVGVGSPGAVDGEMRRIVRAYNLPFDNIDAAAYIAERLDRPTVVVNDANAAALAEARIGAGRGASSLIMLTLGTGVGGGIVLDDRVYTGFNGAGCEVGHMTLRAGGERCTCGRHGCIESYCSAPALIRETMRAAMAEPDSPLGRFYQRTLSDPQVAIDGKTAFNFAKIGCAVAQSVVDVYISDLGTAVASLINGFNPERIVLGGGVAQQGEAFVQAVEAAALRQAFCFDSLPRPSVVKARLGNDAGMVGAAFAVRDALADGLVG